MLAKELDHHRGLPILPEGWKWAELGDLVDPARGICYGIVQPGAHDPNGVPMLNSQDIQDGSVASNIDFHVSSELHNRFKRSTIRGGEVLLTLVGANFGRVAIAPLRFAGYNCSRAVGIIPVLEDPAYVMFSLRSPLSRKFMDDWANTTAQPTFNLGDVAKLPIPIPSKSEQRSIASVLSALDDKIELNRRMNGTLEAMAQAVFKEWFVDGAKEEWPQVPVYEFADVIYGAPFASKLFNTDGDGTGLIRIRELSTHEPATFTTEKHVKATMVHPGDIVVGMDGEFRVHHWRGVPALLNQRVCMFKPKASHLRAFLGLCLVAPMEFYERSTVGTTVIHLGKSDIDEIRLPKPPDALLQQFGQLVEPMLEKRLANAAESRTLAALRDTLLPKLMRGEVRVTTSIPEHNH